MDSKTKPDMSEMDMDKNMDMKDGGDENMVTMDSAMFPDDSMPKKGMKMTFCITSDPDENGQVQGYFCSEESDSKQGDEWEKSFMKEMSPQSEES